MVSKLLFVVCAGGGDDDFLFRRQGTRLPMTLTTFTWRFKCILNKNGLPEQLNVHSLRHTAASLMIAGGADVATGADILRHTQPSITLDIYYPRLRQEPESRQRGAAGDAGDMKSRSQKTVDIPGQLCYHKPRVRDGLLSSTEVNVHG